MLTKDQDEKKKLHGTEWTDEDDYNFCDFLFELKKKIPQGLRGNKYTNQFSLQSKGAVTVEDYWTECQYYDIVWVCFVFDNCNHCCFCCGHPFTMLGVSLFISCKNKIQFVCVKNKAIQIDIIMTKIKRKMISPLNQIIWYLTRIYGALLTWLLKFKLSYRR